MFIAALFEMAKTGSNLSSNKSMTNKSWYTMEYSSAIQMSAVLIYAITQWNLQITILSEINQTKNYMLLFYSHKLWKCKPVYSDRSRLVVTWGWWTGKFGLLQSMGLQSRTPTERLDWTNWRHKTKKLGGCRGVCCSPRNVAKDFPGPQQNRLPVPETWVQPWSWRSHCHGVQTRAPELRSMVSSAQAQGPKPEKALVVRSLQLTPGDRPRPAIWEPGHGCEDPGRPKIKKRKWPGRATPHSDGGDRHSRGTWATGSSGWLREPASTGHAGPGWTRGLGAPGICCLPEAWPCGGLCRPPEARHLWTLLVRPRPSRRAWTPLLRGWRGSVRAARPTLAMCCQSLGRVGRLYSCPPRRWAGLMAGT